MSEPWTKERHAGMRYAQERASAAGRDAQYIANVGLRDMLAHIEQQAADLKEAVGYINSFFDERPPFEKVKAMQAFRARMGGESEEESAAETLDELAEAQGVGPVDDPEKLVGGFEGEMDGFDKAIDEQRHPERVKQDPAAEEKWFEEWLEKRDKDIHLHALRAVCAGKEIGTVAAIEQTVIVIKGILDGLYADVLAWPRGKE